jgi:DNA-binding XRE family transcriptional regulator
MLRFNRKELRGVQEIIAKELDISIRTVRNRVNQGDSKVLELVEKYSLKNIQKEKEKRRNALKKQNKIAENIEKAKQEL